MRADDCEKSSPSEIVRMQHWNVSLSAFLVERKWNVAIEVQCIDGNVVSFDEADQIIMGNHLVKIRNLCMRIDCQKPFCQGFGLIFADVRLAVVLAVEIALLHHVPIDNGHLLKAEADGTFGNDAPYAGTSQQDEVFVQQMKFYICRNNHAGRLPMNKQGS